MSNVRRIVLDVLIPFELSKIDLCAKIVNLKGVEGMDILVEEVERKVETTRITIEGENLDLERIKKDVLDYDPEIIGISALEMQMKYVKIVCESLSTYYKGKVICGGLGPTMSPKETLYFDGVDAVCVGEGDDALVQYATCVHAGPDWWDVNDIKNIWTVDKSKKPYFINNNPLRPLKDLEWLPTEDKEISDLEKILPLKGYQLEHGRGRGCAHKCHYCLNHAYLEQYRCYGPYPNGVTLKEYIRSKPVETTIEELETSIKNHTKIQKIAFTDDDLLLYKDTTDFLKEYKEKINLPFICNIHPQSVSREKVLALRTAGCDTVRVGVESGSERIKQEMLNRHVSNETVAKALHLCKEVGLTVSIYIMIGLPTETIDEVCQTFDFIAGLNPNIVKVATFYPYTGTKLYDFCEKNDLIDFELKEKLDSFDTHTCLKFPKEHQLFLYKAQLVFNWYINIALNNDASIYYSDFLDIVERMSEDEFDRYNETLFLEDDTFADKYWTEKRIPHFAKFMNRSLAIRR